MSNSEVKNNCILLTSDNYDDWAPRMEAYLSKMKVWYTIDSTTELPTALDARARLNKWTVELYQFQWTEDSKDAMRQIIAYCDRARTEEIRALRRTHPNLTPKLVWNHLQARYQKRDTTAYVREWSRLINMRITDENPTHEKMQQHADLFNELCDRIKEMDQSIEKAFTTLYLISIPKSYSTLVDVLTNQGELSRETAIRRVLDKSEWDSKKTADSEDTTDANVALLSRKRSRKPRPESTKCSHCQKPGHSETDCWIKHPEKRPVKEAETKKKLCIN